MRVPAAVAMLLLLLALTTVDRLVCPDGCTDEASHSELSGPRTCGLCQGWSGSAMVRLVEPLAEVTPRPCLSDTADHTAYLPAIEHPPRLL